MIPSHKRSETPERPITFNAAEDLGALQLAELWADRTAWPISERTAYAELATMSALAKWLTRWQPIAIHSAVLAGARMEAIAAAIGNSLQVAFDRWHEWALHQRQFLTDGKLGITEEEYEAIAGRFAAVGIKPYAENVKRGPGRTFMARCRSFNRPCSSAASGVASTSGRRAEHCPGSLR